MESSGMSGGIYSNLQPSMLGLEMSLHHKLPPQHPMPAFPKSKNQSLTLSDDDTSADDGKRKMSPWQRMKWTDNMVRLLIMVVFYIGDEVGASEAAEKKKGAGLLQKKGKWKSVSRAMMERGFYVSPQQCEDKFNDLNKRYKRVNDILGKGTSCRVVENQALLDSMDLPPKVKDEVKKLLNSKHLFFREMCAYHNSCAAAQPEGACLHKAPVTPNLNKGGDEGATKLADDDEGDVDEEDEEEEEEEEEDEEEEEYTDDQRKRARSKGVIEQLDAEMGGVLRDAGKTAGEKRQWLRAKLMALEEQRLGIHSQSFELEKQRLKWLKFSSKKEREMEREKLMNERSKLENERMLLLIKQKELHFMDPSSITG
ncbi:trihelix transcription factor ENAP1 [Salvia miltiorrhiza]|uniref:trihelix transcription factor ENAP1 n=1 Tax=Salvia miltiorrhiza TaxID=226208 RepID=UPI0025AC97A5|nr:trihelix transcription factor ENAP1 [Salvia miltiorrhiza]